MTQTHENPSELPRQPIFNVPGIIIFLIACFVLIHFLLENLFSNQERFELILEFAFIPLRYSNQTLLELSPLAVYWSPFSYSFLHADWLHLGMNSIWLLAFGTVVAKRVQTARFMFLFLLGAVAGAGLHYIFHNADLVPMIGASAAVSACMGAAVRFAFPKGGRFGMADVSQLPIQSLREAFSNKQVVTFTLIWFAINLLAGAGVLDPSRDGQSIAWEAHVGGFIAGLLCFGLIDNSGYQRDY